VIGVLLLSAQAATCALYQVGLQTPVTKHMATSHECGLDHQLKTDRAFEFGLVDKGWEGWAVQTAEEV
jgi:hypothetical protein